MALTGKSIFNGVAALLFLDKLGAFIVRLLPPHWRPVAVTQRIARSRLVTPLRAWWMGQSEYRRRLSINLAWGLFVGLLVTALEGAPPLRSAEDRAIDRMIQLSRAIKPRHPTPLFAFLDIDEVTYHRWGEPFYIPRDKLRALVQYVVNGQPDLIIVDVDLSQPADDRQADDSLVEYLAGDEDGNDVPIILARTFQVPLGQDAPPHQVEKRSTGFLEDTVATTDHLFWGSTLFSVDPDNKLRRWRLWEPICTDGQPGVLPSIQLLALSLWKRNSADAPLAVKEVHDSLKPLEPQDCASEKRSTPVPLRVNIAGTTLDTSPAAQAQRIVYGLPWRLQSGEAYPEVDFEGTSKSVLAIRSASPITDSPDELPATDWLRGRIVVIGASFAASHDIHTTPLGPMPGALVLINATFALAQHGQLTAPPVISRLFILAVLIVAISFTFTMFDSFWAKTITNLGLIVLFLPISFWLFKSGIWLNFAIPLLLVQLQQTAAEFDQNKQLAVKQVE